MPNPFNQQQSQNEMQKMYQMFVNSKNPQQLFKNLAKQNPRFDAILDMLNKGTNPQQLFYSLCQQRGINPQEFLKSITG